MDELGRNDHRLLSFSYPKLLECYDLSVMDLSDHLRLLRGNDCLDVVSVDCTTKNLLELAH